MSEIDNDFNKRTLAIIGGRNFNDYERLEEFVRFYLGRHDYWKDEDGMEYDGWFFKFDKIVSGGAKGADSLAKRFAEQHQIRFEEFLPDWNKYGKRAGFLRNETIIGAADAVLACWDGQSKGTAHSLGLAKKQKKDTFVLYY